jgi:hypothetical protein
MQAVEPCSRAGPRGKTFMAQENNEGADYLRSLKHTSQPEPGSSPALIAESDAKPDGTNVTQYEGGNKRRSPRYKCEGSIELREEGCDVRTWATFTDVSLHGCYVEAQATYPAGTVLNMKLEANGVRVETKGNVRVNYPYLGMGIAFVGMSDESAAGLRQMLATISHACVVVGPGIASTLPCPAGMSGVPKITNAAAAIQELVYFFESRQMLMRDDFLRLLRKSQEKIQANV